MITAIQLFGQPIFHTCENVLLVSTGSSLRPLGALQLCQRFPQLAPSRVGLPFGLRRKLRRHPPSLTHLLTSQFCPSSRRSPSRPSGPRR